jgi:hypothetical protein
VNTGEITEWDWRAVQMGLFEFEEPNPKNVLARVAQFNREEAAIETALALLIERFPLNRQIDIVALKVRVLNLLYSTQILGVYPVAAHIFECDIDSRLDSGDPDLVSVIANVQFKGKNRCNYSFATKYCSWHRPELYPIFDSRAVASLCAYRKKYRFANFIQNDLWDYRKFREVIGQFRSHFDLGEFSFKNIDKFLYEVGRSYFESKAMATGSEVSAEVTAAAVGETTPDIFGCEENRSGLAGREDETRSGRGMDGLLQGPTF